jgi:phosphoesterase RecJ-like protein
MDAKALVDAAKTVIIVTHMHPDGDAIGSMMGVTHTLRSLGKTVYPAVDGGTPDHLAFIPGSKEVFPKLTDQTADLLICLDASDQKRLGEAGAYGFALGCPVLVIDHHATNVRFGKVNLIESITPATCELLVDWFDAISWSIPRDAAYALLTGIVTDTQCFRITQTTPDTLEKAQRLMRLGASLNEITQMTVNRRATSAFRLWARVMPSLKIEDNVIWAVITLEDRLAAGYTEEGGAGGLASLLIEADEANTVGVFIERIENRVELHFRAKPGYNVADLAFSLNGGGHIQASGATVTGELNEVVTRVVPLLKQAAKKTFR